MGARMPDCCSLVSRTPPDRLREWTLETYRDELNRSGLLYEVEYAEDYGLAQLLDEWTKPRKIKMVRVTCSCCGESILLNWGKSETYGYGFVHPDDEEGDWPHTVTAAGDETTCPICGNKVLVNKRAAVKGYYVTAEFSVLSADVVGDQNFLTLTGWTVQRRVYKSGRERLEFIPAEAYVFGPHDCAQLMGWSNSYSGNAGYFIQYNRCWRQPERWSERWGQTEFIFSLTPDLIDRSCLPHCKLDVYMAQRPGAKHYPIVYLRLYQAHPNVEAVLMHGLPRVLDDLIRNKVTSHEWEKNKKGRVELPKLDWTETRPAQMLRLTKEELRMAKQQDWGVLFWDLFMSTKAIGELLTSKDIENAFCLGDEHLALLVPYGHVAKSIRYLLHQCEVLSTEVDAYDADPIPDCQTLTDYWAMSAALGRNLNDPAVRYPDDLISAHDQVSELMKLKEMDGFAGCFRIRRRILAKYSFSADGLLIRPAASQRELTSEGNFLHHCIGTYGKKHAKGKTAIFFIRRTSSPKEPFYTLELDEKTLTVRQNRGMRNCARTPEVQAFEELWLKWALAGAPRDRKGKPICSPKDRMVRHETD